jgi:ArsR family transcriptional regulator, lead/cadmium/zinc/bismuth-responsive transcriptional repressor
MSTRSYVDLKPSLLGDSSVLALAETFKVLGDTTRVRILDVLSRTELCVQDLAGVLGLTQSAVSHQLRLLRSSRLVRTRRGGRQIFYALDDDHIVGLFRQGLEHVEERVGVAPRVRSAPAQGTAPVMTTTRRARPPRISSPL